MAGFSSTGLGQSTLNVFDPDPPTPVALTLDMGNAGTYQQGNAFSVDVAANTITFLGSPMTYLVNNGQVFQIAMAKPGMPAAVRISSLNDACFITPIFDTDSSGLDAWLVVDTAGADGSCSQTADNRKAFVRTGMSTATAPTLLPVGVTVVSPVTDDQKKLLWMLGIDASVATAPKLVAWNPALTRIDVSGGGGLARLYGTSSARLSDSPFLQASGTFRVLSGDAVALSLGPVVYSVTNAIQFAAAAYDKPYLYVVDGDRVMRLHRTEAALLRATLPAGGGDSIGLGQSSTHLVTNRRDSAGVETLHSVAKNDGTLRLLLTSTPGATQRSALTLADNALFYRDQYQLPRGDIRKVDIASGADSLAVADAFTAGLENNPVTSGDLTTTTFRATGLLYCLSPLPAADCRGGSLMKLSVATGASLSLGNFAGSSVNGTWSVLGGAGQGLKGGVLTATGATTSPSTLRRDVYTFNPAQAGSLARVTNVLP